jgi:hypothetical protein
MLGVVWTLALGFPTLLADEITIPYASRAHDIAYLCAERAKYLESFEICGF